MVLDRHAEHKKSTQSGGFFYALKNTIWPMVESHGEQSEPGSPCGISRGTAYLVSKLTSKSFIEMIILWTLISHKFNLSNPKLP